MRIDEYFSQSFSDTFDRDGKETDWLDIGTIEIASGRMAVGDNTFFPNDQLEVDIKAGQYEVQAKVRDYGIDRRISRIRAFQPTLPLESRLIGHISVGFNSVSVCDPVIFLEALEKNTDDEKNLELIHSLYWDRLEDKFGTITLVYQPPAIMAFVRCGWGAGNYEVFELMSGSSRVGIEAIFIEPQEPYLFENVNEFDII